MLNNIMIGRYYPIYSRVHKMNPVAKIICTLLFIISVFISNSLKYNVALLILITLMILNTRVPIKIYLKTILSVKWLLLFIIIINLIFQNTVDNTIIMLLRIICILWYTTLLTLTTPPTELTYGLSKVLSPLRIIGIPVNRLALSLTLALRFIPTIIDESNKILKSQASRGIDYYNSNIAGKLMAINSLIVPMFTLTLKRADNLADSMEVRLYNVDDKRINFRQNKWHFYDTFLLLIHLAIFVGIILKGVGILWDTL